MYLKVFKYSQYIKYIHILRLNAVLELAEEETEYKLKQKNKENGEKTHDKLVKSILKDEKELSKFISQFINNEIKINSEDLIKFTNSYITKKYRAKESDLVYMLKNKEIFFLIEHQSNIDSTMPYRMLNYCIDIINEWCQSKKMKKVKRYPIVVPIVIYTGDRKWTVPKNFKEKQVSTCIFENYKIDLQYNLVDINRISDESLMQKHTMFGYGMLIEKAKDKKDLIKKLNLIIKNCNDERQLEKLKDIILYALDNSICNIEQEDLIEKIDEKVGDKDMSTLIERLTAENRRILNQGIAQGTEAGIKTGIKTGMKTGIKTGMNNGIKKQKTEVVKRMLAMNFEENIILEVSGVTKKELEEIKKEK